MKEVFPKLAQLDVFLNDDTSIFGIFQKYLCKTADLDATAKRISVDLNSGTAQVTRNIFALNPGMQPLMKNQGFYSRGELIGYGWGVRLSIGDDRVFSLCYDADHIDQMKADTDTVVPDEPMACSSL